VRRRSCAGDSAPQEPARAAVAGGDAGGEAQTSPATSFLGLGFGDSLSFSIQDRIAFISVSSSIQDRDLSVVFRFANESSFSHLDLHR